MKILLIGGKGSIGMRYQAILSYLGVDFQVYDKEEAIHQGPEHYDADKWLICTPTNLHYAYCMDAIEHQVPFLCEKPLSKSLKECDEIMNGLIKKGMREANIVCNYKFALDWLHEKPKSVLYDYYRTGADGKLWDCCQLIYICPDAVIRDTAPIWKLEVNSRPLEYSGLELSYIHMINNWLYGGSDRMWAMSDAYAMTQAVIEREKREQG